MASTNVGVPYKLLKDFYNRKVIVETRTGDIFKGFLLEAEDNMSVSLATVRVLFADGKATDMASVYIKGSRMRLISLPDSARDTLATLIREQSFGGRGRGRGRGGFRGGRRGGGRRGGGGFGGRPSCDRYR